jgi:gliding motility-associated-like protein
MLLKFIQKTILTFIFSVFFIICYAQSTFQFSYLNGDKKGTILQFTNNNEGGSCLLIEYVNIPNIEISICNIDSNGEILWSKSIENNDRLKAHSIEKTQNGDFIVVLVPSVSSNFQRVNILKVSKIGTILWNKIFTYSLPTIKKVLVLPAGYIFTARNINFGFMFYMNEDGQIQWEYHTEKPSMIEDIDIDSLGNLYCSGYIQNDIDNDGLIAKFNTNGELKWAKSLHIYDRNILLGIECLSNSKIIIGGYIENIFNYTSAPIYSSFDSLGNFTFSKKVKKINSIDDLIFQDIKKQSNKGDFFISVCEFNNLAKSFSKLSKIDKNGNIIWSNEYSGLNFKNIYIEKFSVEDETANIFTCGSTEYNGVKTPWFSRMNLEGIISPNCCPKPIELVTSDTSWKENPIIFVQSSLINSIEDTTVQLINNFIEKVDLCENNTINLDFDVFPDSICLEQCFKVTLSNPTETVDYTWEFVKGTPNAAQFPSESTICFSDTAKFKIIAKNGICLVSKDTFFTLKEPKLYIPNAFTPNEDGINDTFSVLKFNCEVDSFHFRIYSRWGNLIFESDKPTMAWDGTFKNSQSPADVYLWTLKYSINGNVIDKNGDVTLIR